MAARRVERVSQNPEPFAKMSEANRTDLGMTLTKSRSAALAAERSETPSPQKKMVGRGFRSWYGAVARDLS